MKQKKSPVTIDTLKAKAVAATMSASVGDPADAVTMAVMPVLEDAAEVIGTDGFEWGDQVEPIALAWVDRCIDFLGKPTGDWPGSDESTEEMASDLAMETIAGSLYVVEDDDAEELAEQIAQRAADIWAEVVRHCQGARPR